MENKTKLKFLDKKRKILFDSDGKIRSFITDMKDYAEILHEDDEDVIDSKLDEIFNKLAVNEDFLPFEEE